MKYGIYARYLENVGRKMLITSKDREDFESSEDWELVAEANTLKEAEKAIQNLENKQEYFNL